MAYKINNGLTYRDTKKRAKYENLEDTLKTVVNYKIDNSTIEENSMKIDTFDISLNVKLDENNNFIFNGMSFYRDAFKQTPSKDPKQPPKIEDKVHTSFGENLYKNTLNIFQDGSVSYDKSGYTYNNRNKNITKENLKNKVESDDSFYNDYQEILYLQKEFENETIRLYEDLRTYSNGELNANIDKDFNQFYNALIDHYNDSIIRHTEELKILNYNSNFGNERFNVCFDEEFKNKMSMEIETIKLKKTTNILKDNNLTRDVTQSRYEILEKNINNIKLLEKNIAEKYIKYESIMKESGRFTYNDCKKKINKILSEKVIDDDDLESIKNYERKKIASGLSKEEEKDFMDLNKKIYENLENHIEKLQAFHRNYEYRDFKPENLENKLGHYRQYTLEKSFSATDKFDQAKEDLNFQMIQNIEGQLNLFKKENNNFINFHYTKKYTNASKIMESEQKFDKIFKEERNKRDEYQENLVKQMDSIEKTIQGKDIKAYERELDKMISGDEDFNRLLLAINAHSGSIKALRMLDPANKELVESVLGTNYEQLTKDEIFEKLTQFNNEYIDKNTGELFSIDVIRQKSYKINDDYDKLINYVKYIDNVNPELSGLINKKNIEKLDVLEQIKEERYSQLINPLIHYINKKIDTLNPEDLTVSPEKLKIEIANGLKNKVCNENFFRMISILENTGDNEDKLKANVFRVLYDKENQDITYETLYTALSKVGLTNQKIDTEFNIYILKRDNETKNIIKDLMEEKIEYNGKEVSKHDIFPFVNVNRVNELNSINEKSYNKILDYQDKYKMIYDFFEFAEFDETITKKFDLIFKNEEFLQNIENKTPYKSLGIMLELRKNLQNQLNTSLDEKSKENIQSKLYFIENEILGNSKLESSAFINNPKDYKIYNLLIEHSKEISNFKERILEEYKEIEPDIEKNKKELILIDENKYIDDKGKIRNFKEELTKEEKESYKENIISNINQIETDFYKKINKEVMEINKNAKNALEYKEIINIKQIKADTKDEIGKIFDNFKDLGLSSKEVGILYAGLLYQDGISQTRTMFLNDFNLNLDNFDEEKQQRIKNSTLIQPKDEFLHLKLMDSLKRFKDNDNFQNFHKYFEKLVDIYEKENKGLTYNQYTECIKEFLNKETDIIIADHRMESLRMDDTQAIESLKIGDFYISDKNLSFDGVNAIIKAFNEDTETIEKTNVFCALLFNEDDVKKLTTSQLVEFQQALELIGKNEINSNEINVCISEQYLEKTSKLLSLYGDKDKVLILNIANDMIFIDENNKMQNFRDGIKDSLLSNINEGTLNISEIKNFIDNAIEFSKENNYGSDISLNELILEKLEESNFSDLTGKEQDFIIKNINLTKDNIDFYMRDEFLRNEDFIEKILNHPEFTVDKINKIDANIIDTMNESHLNLILKKVIENDNVSNLDDILSKEQIDSIKLRYNESLNYNFNQNNLNLLKIINENSSENMSLNSFVLLADIEKNKNLNKIEVTDNSEEKLRKEIVLYILEKETKEMNSGKKTPEEMLQTSYILKDDFKSKVLFRTIIDDENLKTITENSENKSIKDSLHNEQIKKNLDNIYDKYKQQISPTIEEENKKENVFSTIFNKIRNHKENSNEQNHQKLESLNESLLKETINNFKNFYEKDNISIPEIKNYYDNLNDTEKRFLFNFIKEQQPDISDINDISDKIIFDKNSINQKEIIDNTLNDENNLDL